MEIYRDGETYKDAYLMMPVFEDAHSIQTVIRQVVQLLLQRRIPEKTASLLLYALQIAPSNLKRMSCTHCGNKEFHILSAELWVSPDRIGSKEVFRPTFRME